MQERRVISAESQYKMNKIEHGFAEAHLIKFLTWYHPFRMYVEGKKCDLLGKFCIHTKRMIPIPFFSDFREKVSEICLFTLSF